MKFIIRCKRLEEITRHQTGQVATGEVISDKDAVLSIMAGFNSVTENLDCYFSVDIKLISDDIKIGDEYEVEIRKV